MQPVQSSPIESHIRIIPLGEAGVHPEEVGGKAARLGALMATGEHVPDGFCVVGQGDLAVALATDAYTRMGLDVPVAVRSSASAEDGSEASFAGQFETVLSVTGSAELAVALARCWESVSGVRAAAYLRKHQGVVRDDQPSQPLSMSVLVQRMIDARAAGVAFSADPLTGAREAVVIEAVSGLGDAVVSGEVNPDRFVVADNGKMEVQFHRGSDLPIDDDEARAIATLVRRIEGGGRVPQDIEWAFDEAGLWLLQARPMTALPDAVSWASPVPGAKWIKDLQAAEWATGPLSPLGATTTFETMAIAREQYRGWPTIPKSHQPGHTLINGWLYMRVGGPLISLIMNIASFMITLLVGGLDGHRRLERRWGEPLARLESLAAVRLAETTAEALHRHVDGLLDDLGWWWIEISFFASVVRVMQQIVGQLRPPGLDEPAVLFRGNDSLLLGAERALRRAARDPAELDDYLARFGHFVESADPIHLTLRESSELVTWQLVAARAGKEDPDERLARMRDERARAGQAVISMRGPRGFLARRALSSGQSHAAHTDDAVFHFQRVLAALRGAFLEQGRRLAGAGVIEEPEDVFYLERVELWGGDGVLTGKVDLRRLDRDRQVRIVPPPLIPPASDPAWTDDPMMKMVPAELRAQLLERGVRYRDGRRVLVGTPASPGQARGIARVVTGPADFQHFQPGNVLVAHATSPIWTPLLAIAAAAVTEVGGPFALAAIVAREFGIPLVNGALDATLHIADGTPVVVDGSAGIVEF